MQAVSGAVPSLPSSAKNRWSVLELVFLGAATPALAGFAAFNGYPLVLSDTGAYLYSGFSSYVPPNRPLSYGLFLRASSLGLSAWPTVVVQALLVSVAAMLVVKTFAPPAIPRLAWLASVPVLVAGSLAVNASLLMPDIFSPLSLLAIALLAGASFRKTTAAFLALLLVFSNMVALSHLLTSTVVALGLLLAWAVSPALRRRSGQSARIASVALLVGLSWLAHVGVNAASGQGPVVSRAGSVFFTARLLQIGLLPQILRERCPAAKWRICEYQDALPATSDEFLWEPASPLGKTGGWSRQSVREYNAIVRASFSRASWVERQLAAAVSAFADQLIGFWMGGTCFDGTVASRAVRLFFPHEFPQFERAREQRLPLDLRWLNGVQHGMVLLGLLAMTWMSASRRLRARLDRRAVIFASLAVAGVFANAAVCGVLSEPSVRYQFRVVPLVWLAALALLLSLERSPPGLTPEEAARQ